MSGPAPTVATAIAEAARLTGVSAQFLSATARRESSFDPEARAATSSAAGLYQFIESTWIETLERHGERLGLSDAVANLGDPENRAEVLELRFDPRTAALMAGALAQDNSDSLQRRLGREPDAGELYVAHVMGAGGAVQLLEAADAQPDASAVEMFPAAARANRNLFYDSSGAPRSVAALADRLRDAVNGGAAGESAAVAAMRAVQTSPGARPVVRSLGETSPHIRIVQADPGETSYAPPLMLRGATMPLRLAAPVVEALASLDAPARANDEPRPRRDEA